MTHKITIVDPKVANPEQTVMAAGPKTGIHFPYDDLLRPGLDQKILDRTKGSKDHLNPFKREFRDDQGNKIPLKAKEILRTDGKSGPAKNESEVLPKPCYKDQRVLQKPGKSGTERQQAINQTDAPVEAQDLKNDPSALADADPKLIKETSAPSLDAKTRTAEGTTLATALNAVMQKAPEVQHPVSPEPKQAKLDSLVPDQSSDIPDKVARRESSVLDGTKAADQVQGRMPKPTANPIAPNPVLRQQAAAAPSLETIVSLKNSQKKPTRTPATMVPESKPASRRDETSPTLKGAPQPTAVQREVSKPLPQQPKATAMSSNGRFQSNAYQPVLDFSRTAAEKSPTEIQTNENTTQIKTEVMNQGKGSEKNAQRPELVRAKTRVDQKPVAPLKQPEAVQSAPKQSATLQAPAADRASTRPPVHEQQIAVKDLGEMKLIQERDNLDPKLDSGRTVVAASAQAILAKAQRMDQSRRTKFEIPVTKAGRDQSERVHRQGESKRPDPVAPSQRVDSPSPVFQQLEKQDEADSLKQQLRDRIEILRKAQQSLSGVDEKTQNNSLHRGLAGRVPGSAGFIPGAGNFAHPRSNPALFSRSFAAELVDKLQDLKIQQSAAGVLKTTFMVQAGQLGELDIEFHQESGREQITIFVENEHSQQDLQRILPQIAENLNQKGYSFTGLEVEIRNSKKDSQFSSERELRKARDEKSGPEALESGMIEKQRTDNRKYGYNTMEVLA